jgi:hypothetical protein
MPKPSGDSGRRVSGILFRSVHLSFTTQDNATKGPIRTDSGATCGGFVRWASVSSTGAMSMPYALFCKEAKLSKTYPTEADVWKLARLSGLVVDAVSEHGGPIPRAVLDNDYEIRPCHPDPEEDPDQNQADAERQATRDLQFSL